jgi:hypothetical protein
MVVACTPGASIPAGSLFPHPNGLCLEADAAAVSQFLDNCSPICDLPLKSERANRCNEASARRPMIILNRAPLEVAPLRNEEKH